ncbi:MAG: hypothetical protein ACP5P1_04375 [Acidimicrobiales bacterium]
MTARELQTFRSGGAFFEAPRWHDDCWWVSDFYRQRVYRYLPDSTEEVVVEVEGQPSGLGWLPDGSLVVASMTDRRLRCASPAGSCRRWRIWAGSAAVISTTWWSTPPGTSSSATSGST